MSKMKKQEILKNQLIQKAQQYFINSPYGRGVVSAEPKPRGA
jgi:hypothetical protein